MATGVAQIWRFFSHCRRGFTGRKTLPQAKGLILALDDWFMARGSMIEQVLERAEILAQKMDVNIIAEDRRPIAFTSIYEIEIVLRTASAASFFATVDLATSEERGWMFSTLHQKVTAPKTDHRPYPFENELENLLPWWGLRKADQTKAGAP